MCDHAGRRPGRRPVEGGDVSGIRMLIVEDDRRLAELVATRLRDLGHEVETAADGDRGYQLAATGRFDLAVLDVMLPGRDGLSLLRDLRSNGSTMPVVVLTAKDSVPDRVEGLRAGADDYLVKPDRKSTRLNSSHVSESRMPSSA